MQPSKSITKADFSKGICRWLVENDYHVGMPAKDMDALNDIDKTGAKRAKAVIKMLSNGYVLLVTGGKISKEELASLLRPFSDLVDIVGYDFSYGSNLLLVLYADDLAPIEITRRVEEIIELAKPLRKKASVRVQFRPQTMEIELVLAFFSKKECEKCLAALMPNVWKYAMRPGIKLETKYAVISERKVFRGAKKGFIKGSWVAMEHSLGVLKILQDGARKIGGRLRGFYTEYLVQALEYAE
jgi:hypothetical protein